MEKHEKEMDEIHETNVGETRQKEPIGESELIGTTDEPTGNAEEQPKNRKKRFRRIVGILVAAAVIGVAVVLICKSCKDEKEYDYEYDYEYGEEPSAGFVLYTHSSSKIINPTTKEVIVDDIDWCHYSSDREDDPIVLFAKKGKRGFCNIATNEVIVQPTTYTKAWVFSEGLAAVEKDGYIGFVNTKGKVAIKCKFSYRGNPLTEFVFHDGHCVVADSSNKIGVINTKGQWVITPLYDHVELAKDYAIVHNDGDFKKQLDFNGNVLQDGIIDYINTLYYDVNYTDLQSGEPKLGQAKINDLYEYCVGGYFGIIDSKGGFITPPIYTDISGITPTLFKARLQDWVSIVMIDNKGNVLSKVSK
ncbi:MAG: WG repeat-containing protein [Bacteroidales bacterium]|nr:WG repeat-containing protein [Bacteroidales bacterium]